MTTLRQIFAGAFRDAVLRIEEKERKLQWEGVHAAAQRVASGGSGDYGWGRALASVADPTAVPPPAPIVGARTARGWDRALAAFAPGAGDHQPQAVDQHSRMIVRLPGVPRPGAGAPAPAYLRGSTAASWDRALKEFTPAASDAEHG